LIDLERKNKKFTELFLIIINRIDEVDIDMGTGRNLRQGGRNLINHGHQIEKEIPGGGDRFTESKSDLNFMLA